MLVRNQSWIKFNDLNYFLYNIASDHFHNAHQINQFNQVAYSNRFAHSFSAFK